MITGLLGLLLPVALKFFDLYLSRAKDKKEAWDAFQKFQRELDAYRSKRVHDSAQRQRDRLKNPEPTQSGEGTEGK